MVKGVTDIDGWVAQRLARHANPQGAFDQEQEDGRWTQINERRTEDGGTVIEYSDITERKHSEIELVRAKEEAEEATLMKGRFLANMSHELRTPLTSIKGSLSLIASGTAGAVPDDVASLVRIADDSAVSLVGLINDILDFEKIRAGQLAYDFEPLDIRGVVEQAIEANRAYGDQFGVTFHSQPAQADHLRVKGDRNRLIQVMTNLLSNAAKYSPGGGAVEISIESRAPSVRVSARDHGPGIPEEYRKNMFGEFYQVYEKGHCCPVNWTAGFLKAKARAGLGSKMGGVDLNLMEHFAEFFRGGAHEHRQELVRSTDGFPAVDDVCPDRRLLRWRPPGSDAHLRRAIPGHGLRPIDLAREPARH